ncbi:unnamed protein product [Lepeophtheirus salmonis]|uniref:(salmon louse) hypothetical protein n=1 Tax=Lepeophtheirus salmonis TaxID=72036 RepID=A0A7R8HAI7_LEPSM|nr:unnamed protein product [Lepeophtheirus salmonis]CAF2957383.1 unnamed protein product [Lepeophtheirus salmonis]
MKTHSLKAAWNFLGLEDDLIDYQGEPPTDEILDDIISKNGKETDSNHDFGNEDVNIITPSSAVACGKNGKGKKGITGVDTPIKFAHVVRRRDMTNINEKEKRQASKRARRSNP